MTFEPNSYWLDSSFPSFPAFTKDEITDIAVVGGGICGLTTAYLLAKAGKSVVLLERGRCAEVDTGHTSAHLAMVTDKRLMALIKSFGESHAQAAWDAGVAAISQIDTIVRENAFTCDFSWVDGYLHAPGGTPQPGSGDTAAEFREEAERAQLLGFDAEFLSDVPFVGGPGIRFDSQARIHPRKYLAQLAGKIKELGGKIYEHSSADEFSADPMWIQSNKATLRCNTIVLATHNPLAGLTGTTSATLFQSKLALYTSYVVAGRAPKDAVPDALFWDTGDPYSYLRVEPHRGYDLVILGGQDHKTGQVTNTEPCYARLKESLKHLVPSIEITHRWSGQVIETPDGLPYIGRTAPQQYAATGVAGNGLTFGTLGAMMVADSILGKATPWDELFDPARKALLHGFWDYLKENADYPYYFLRDRFVGVETRPLRSIKRGQGKVLDKDGAKVAAYRALDGSFVQRSAICPHMGCIVKWNSTEETWDCPCHGSRFKPTGEVISGPAESALSEVTASSD